MLVVSEYPQQELSQPMQRRVTPCNTVFSHLTPGFLPLSQPTLVFFCSKTKHIPAKMATELLWSQQPLIDCELGCARTEQSIVSQCFSSYFWAFPFPLGQVLHPSHSPSPPNNLFPSILRGSPREFKPHHCWEGINV